MRRSTVGEWLHDILLGGGAGALVAVIAAVNLVILLGVEEGYEASLGDVFRHSFWGGTLVVLVLVAGPVLGSVLARRRRRTGPPPATTAH